MVSRAIQQSLVGTARAAAGSSLVSRWFGGFYSFAFHTRSTGAGGCFTPRGAC